jgi:hypothetical protein
MAIAGALLMGRNTCFDCLQSVPVVGSINLDAAVVIARAFLIDVNIDTFA